MLQLQNKNASKGPLWLVEKQYSIGSDAGCDISVDDTSLNANHAELRINGDRVTVVNLSNGHIQVDGKAVESEEALGPGSTLRIGAEEFEVIDPKSNAAMKPENATAVGWALKALNTALEDKHFPLHGSQVLGRSQDCDVSLGVVHLSRKHAKISVTQEGLLIEDLNSSNGTYINGKKVAKGLAVAGDELSFDTLRFRVIGPPPLGGNTVKRAATNNDAALTTLRPAITVPKAEPQAQPEIAGSAKSHGRPHAHQHTAKQNHNLTNKPSSGDSATDEARDSAGYGMLWLGAAVLVCAGVAWYFLK